MAKSTKEPATEEPVVEAEEAVEQNLQEELAQSAQQVEGLTIQDLSTAMQIIAVCQARGAIKAEEMVVVGGLYSKLQNFLQASGALAEKAEADAKKG